MSVSRFFRAAALLIGAGIVASCARPFPERLNWYGEHPSLYTMAFRAAAEEALVRSLTGQTYYDHMGDAAYTLSTTGICTQATLARYLVEKERGCHLFGGPPPPDCLNANACVSVQYDRGLFADPRIRGVVEDALRRPCEFLTPPSRVRHWDATANFGMTASANWRILQCDGAGVFASSIEFDGEESVLRFEFHRR